MDFDVGKGEDENVEVEDDDEVNKGEDPAQVPIIAPLAQVLVTEPIIVPSSNSKTIDDLDFLEIHSIKATI